MQPPRLVGVATTSERRAFLFAPGQPNRR